MDRGGEVEMLNKMAEANRKKVRNWFLFFSSSSSSSSSSSISSSSSCFFFFFFVFLCLSAPLGQFHRTSWTLPCGPLRVRSVQVFPTENIRELGLPTAESLKEGDNLKVADLQELSSVTFSELDPNTSYDVWCTSEYNDFRDDQAGQDLLTPFPKSTVLSIDSSYYTADVLAAC